MARTASTATPKAAARGRRSSAAKQGAAQHANEANLKETTSITPAAAGGSQGNGDNKPVTNDANLRMPHIQHSVLVQSIKTANAGFKAAVSLEIAVVCAVYMDVGATDVKAKKELYSVYKDAGYDCEPGGQGKDYKTVNRRINYATKFFNSLPQDELKRAMNDARDEAAIQNLLVHISAKYGLKTMSDVLAASGEQPPSRTPRLGGGKGGGADQGQGTGTQVFGSTGAQNPVTATAAPDAGDKGVMAALQQSGEQREAQQRREFDDASKWGKFTYEGATIIVPVEYKTACLHELGIKLIQAAAHMRGDRIDMATLNTEFKEAVANH